MPFYGHTARFEIALANCKRAHRCSPIYGMSACCVTQHCFTAMTLLCACLQGACLQGAYVPLLTMLVEQVTPSPLQAARPDLLKKINCVQVNAFITCASSLTPAQTTETTAIRQCGLNLEALADTAGTLSTKLTQVTDIYNGLKYLQTLQWDAAHTTTSAPSSTTPTMKALYNDLLL